MTETRSIVPILRSLRPLLAKTGIGKLFPDAKIYYDNLTAAFLPRTDILDVQGSKMFLDHRHPNPNLRKTFRAYAFNRIHEVETTALFTGMIRPGDTILDLGANIGYFTLLAARLAGPEGRVFSFEPDPTNFELLRKNIDLNGYRWVTAVHAAVGAWSGRERLYLCPYDTGHHTVRSRAGIDALMPPGGPEEIDSVEIELVKLDDFFAQRGAPINLIKIDVEGFESSAFEGMTDLLRRSEEIGVFAEYYPLLIEKQGVEPRRFLDAIFSAYGFQVAVVGGDYSAGRGRSGPLLRVSSPEEVAALCSAERAHVNLFLSKGPRYERLFPEGN